MSRTPGHCGAKGHARLAAITLQQNRPCRLQQGIEGDLVVPGKLTQARGGGGVQQYVVTGMATALARRRQGVAKQGRRGQRLQLHAPELLAGAGVLRQQPAHIVGITPSGRWRHLSGVPLQDLPQQLGIAPAIHQDVVAGVDQLITPGRQRY